MAIVGGESEVGDAEVVAGEVLEESSGEWGPGFDGFVGGGSGEESAVVGELDGGYGALVGGESVVESVGRCSGR